MRNSASEDYFSFMSERGKSKSKHMPPRPPAVVPPQVAPPTPTSANAGPRAESRMEVTESSISDTMIQQMFGLRHAELRHADEPSATRDD